VPHHQPTTVLTALGFSAELDRTYQRLRSETGRELARVAASMVRTPEELLAELEPLIDAGVVRVVGTTIEVVAPVEALRTVLAAQSARVERAQRGLDEVTAAMGLLSAEESRRAPGQLESSEPLEGELATGGDIFGLIRSLVLRGSGDLLWLRPDQFTSPREDQRVALIAEALAQGRRSRVIYPVRALQVAAPELAGRVAVGEEIRVLPEVATRLLVIGDSHAVLPEPLGLADAPLSVVRQRGIVEAMTLWFEQLWDRAVVPDLDPGLDREPRLDLRRFLLEQLAAGAHDEQIARKLGISLRTVRRRVAALMSELGADSRFQAGVEAARRGWI
jgi:DNA-binding CsgD family transcriptional regulator